MRRKQVYAGGLDASGANGIALPMVVPRGTICLIYAPSSGAVATVTTRNGSAPWKIVAPTGSSPQIQVPIDGNFWGSVQATQGTWNYVFLSSTIATTPLMPPYPGVPP